MDYLENSKPIKVGAIFKGSEILPKWFIWESRKYSIEEVNYVWLEKKGHEKVHYFSVTDKVNNYEISFNSEQTTWSLNKIYSN